MILPPTSLHTAVETATRNQSPRFKSLRLRSVLDHGTNNFSCVHHLEGIVDRIQRQHFADHFVDLDLAVEVPIHIARQLRTAFDTAECRAAPDAPGDQLERAGRYFLARPGDA